MRQDSSIRKDISKSPESSLKRAKENYELIKQQKSDPFTKGRILATLSMAHEFNADLVSALECRLSSIAAYEKANAHEEVIRGYNLLGGLFYNIGEYDRTIKYTRKALNIAIQKNLTSHLSILYNNLAGAYRKLNDYDQAIAYAQKVIYQAKLNEDKRSMIYGLSLFGEISLDQQKCDSALYYFDKIYKSDLPIDKMQPYEKSFLNLNFSRAHWCKKDTSEALNYAQQALQISKENKFLNLYSEASQILLKLWDAKQNSDSIYRYGKIAFKAKDSLWNQEKEKQLNRMIINHRESELDSQRQLIRRQSQISTYSIIAGAIFFLLLVALIFYNRKARKLNAELSSQKQELEKLNRFKDKVFSTVVHDFKTPINSLESMLKLIIGGHLSSNEAQELAEKMLLNLQQSKDSVNNLIVWVKKQMQGFELSESQLSVENLLQETATYHKLLADSKNIDLVISLQEPLDIYSDYEVLKVILNNLVSNAIKFTKKDGKVIIKAHKTENDLIIQVIDNGIGFDAELLKDIFSLTKPISAGTSMEKGTGLGLIICKELADRLGGKIEIKSAKNSGTKIAVILPNAE